MEATKKTPTTKTALLVVAIVSILLSGLFVATAATSDANEPAACPDGFSLTADAKNCFQAAVVTSADNPNSCAQGQLTPDGTTCYVNAQILPQEGATLCPSGYSPDDSLGGMCARFEAASQNGAACPDGARGVAGGCYILVAKGPAAAAACETSGATVAGTTCVVTGAAPTNGASTCPVSTTVIQTGAECYTLIARAVTAGSCDTSAGYFAFNTVCKLNNTGTSQTEVVAFACPNPSTGETVTKNMHTTDGTTKIESCEYTPTATPGDCPTGTTLDSNGVDCRRPVDLRPGALQCSSGYGLVDGKCIRYESTATSAPQCPTGSVEDTVGDCRKPVADAAGAYFCADADGALNGTSCVFTAGFLIDPSPTLYKCEAGERTVIGSGSDAFGDGSAVQVICLLGAADANTSTNPSCLQGVLSTDNDYCIVARSDTAPTLAVTAPVPSFTG